MDAELAALLERARHHVMTAEEIHEQRISFVMGQTNAMREQVEDAIKRMHGAEADCTYRPENGPHC